MARIKQINSHTFDVTIELGKNEYGDRLRVSKRLKYPEEMRQNKVEKTLAADIVRLTDTLKNEPHNRSKNITFKEFVEMWKNDYATKSLAPKTIYRYNGLLKRIEAEFGKLKLRDITDTNIRNFINKFRTDYEKETTIYKAKPELRSMLSAKQIKLKDLAMQANISVKTVRTILQGANTNCAGIICEKLDIEVEDAFVIVSGKDKLSDQTVQHYFRFLSTLLNTAVQWKLIKENPAKFVKTPKVERQEARSMELDEIDVLLAALEQEHIKYKAIVYIALCTGCRLGELSALTWDRINFETAKITIDRSAQYIPGRGVFVKSPKNKTSKRILSAPIELIDILLEYKVWQDSERIKLGDLWKVIRDETTGNELQYVFTQREGGQIFPYTPSNWFRKFRKEHNVPNIRFHEIRHTHATSLIDSGVDLQTVSRRMGHAKITTTTSIYSHKFRPTDEVAASTFSDKILNHRSVETDEKNE
jgi:integrase